MKLLYRIIFCIGINVLLCFIAIQLWVLSSKKIAIFNPIKLAYTSKLSIDNIVEKSKYAGANISQERRPKEEMVLVVVVCGDRMQETLTMIKSAILFSSTLILKAVVITETNLIPAFEEKLGEWVKAVNGSFKFEVHPISFPQNGEGVWKQLFKPCASQRLFLPSVLKHIDSVLYVDTDVLFLSPLDKVWNHFGKMNSTQLAALSPEHEDPNTGWYNRFAKHPYYGPLGVNSGVMLMNLTRMRSFHWEGYLTPILKEYRLKITWGDQDIINIIFHYHPERLYVYDCRHNYRSDHCMYSSVCKRAEVSGVRVLHGSRGTFHGNKQPLFATIFNHIQQFQVGGDAYNDLLVPLESALQQTESTNCGKIHQMFTKEMRLYLEALAAPSS